MTRPELIDAAASWVAPRRPDWALTADADGTIYEVLSYMEILKARVGRWWQEAVAPTGADPAGPRHRAAVCAGVVHPREAQSSGGHPGDLKPLAETAGVHVELVPV